jgi:hypothetical protein
MATQLDASVGLKKESVFGTAVVPDHFVEFNSEGFKWEPKFVQGNGMRVGTRGPRAARRSLVSQSASGDLEIDLPTKGAGIFFEAAMGAGASTAVPSASGAFQQNFSPAATDFLPSYTIQKGVPQLGGSMQPYTYPGMMCSGFELTAALEAIVKLKTNWVGREQVTSTALAAPSYPAGAELFTFLHGSIAIGGTVTPRTTTTPASGGQSVADILDFSLSYENNLDGGGQAFGGGGKATRKKAVGALAVTGKVTAEYDNNTLRDAYLAQTDLELLMTFRSLVPITGSVFPTLQIHVPCIRLEGDTPTANGGDIVKQSIGFTGLENLTAPMIAVTLVTTDTAI